jgi:hypothetical protein
MSVRPNRMAEPKLRTVRLGWKAQKGAGLPRRRGGMPSGVGRSTSSLPWSFGRDERARSGHHGHESPQNGAIKRRRVTYVWTYVVALCSLVFPWRASAAQRGAARGGLSLLGCQFVAASSACRPSAATSFPAPLPADLRCGSGGQPRRARRFQSRIVSARATAGTGTAASAAIAARQIRVDLMISRSSYAYLLTSAGKRGVRGRGVRGSPPRSAAGGGRIHAPRATGSWSRRVLSA